MAYYYAGWEGYQSRWWFGKEWRSPCLQQWLKLSSGTHGLSRRQAFNAIVLVISNVVTFCCAFYSLTGLNTGYAVSYVAIVLGSRSHRV